MKSYKHIIFESLKVKLTTKQKDIIDFLIGIDKKHSKEYGCSLGNKFTVGQQLIADKLGIKRPTVSEHLSNLKTLGVLIQTDKGDSFRHINSSYMINYQRLYGDDYEDVLNRNKDTIVELSKINEPNGTKMSNNMNNNTLVYDFDSKKYLYDCSDREWTEHNMSEIALTAINNILSSKTPSMTDCAILSDINNYSSYAAYWFGDAICQGHIHSFDEFTKMLQVKGFGDVNLYETAHRELLFMRTAWYIKYTPSQFLCLLEKIQSIGLSDNSDTCRLIRQSAVQDTYNYVYDRKCINDLYEYILTASCAKLYDDEIKVFPNRGLLDVKEILGI